MNPQTRVGVVHAPFGAANLFDIKIAAQGLCQIVLILPAEVAAKHPDLLQMATRLFEVCVIPVQRLATDVRPLGLAGLTTFHDAWLELVDAVVAATGLPRMATVDPWDKLVQRRRLARHGLTQVRAVAVESAEEFLRGIADLGTPCVLKPRRGVGGSGVAFIDSADDMAFQLANRQQWQTMMLETRLPDGRHPASVTWLADFVSVETVSTGDRRTHVATFDKSPVHVSHRGGRDGADAVSVTGDITPSRLPAEWQAELASYVYRCLDAMGIQWRVTHTEVKLTSDGPEIIEINGRVGGHLNRLLRLLKGPDLVAAALCVAAGQQPSGTAITQPGYAMGMFPPFPNRHKVVESHVTTADLRALPGVVGVDEVAAAGASPSDTDYRMANITLFAASAEELDDVAPACRASVAELFAADLSPAARR